MENLLSLPAGEAMAGSNALGSAVAWLPVTPTHVSTTLTSLDRGTPESMNV